LNDSKQTISTVKNVYGLHENTYTIPLNTKWIRYDAVAGSLANYSLYEIQVIN
jgi:hypothetical protein